jgi:hypothetical protein
VNVPQTCPPAANATAFRPVAVTNHLLAILLGVLLAAAFAAAITAAALTALAVAPLPAQAQALGRQAALSTPPTAAAAAASAAAPAPSAAPAASDTRAGPGGRALPVVRAEGAVGPIVVDGVLDEVAWARAVPATDFRQYSPEEGAPATQRTEVRFLYDADALYIGARLYDDLGAEGVRTRLGRRDQHLDSDNLQLVFDTFHDRAGQTIFTVNPSGVKYDAGQASPFADPSWDPVWELATRIDSLGWTAEIRIPFSQLRFPAAPEQTWGLQIWRRVERLNEHSMWSFWGRDEVGGPRLFGHLEGLRVERRPLGLELMPYAVSRAAYVQPAAAGDPFHDARAYDWRLGGDVKALLASNLTLDATFNPDFGQVEVDPAVVNLSAFETFYAERRPFFVEGSGLFGFGTFRCRFCSNVSGMNLFYSRRIGRRPQGTLPFDTEYASSPQNTAILGAAKVTGRTPGGVQVGVLNALTRAEHVAALTPAGENVSREVEPLTNYFVGRVRRNFRGGDVRVGAMATSVIRGFGYDSLAHQLPRHAEAVGADWELFWRDRRYSLMGNVALSQVAGDEAAMLRLQRSSARYFQRPDRGEHGNGLFTDGLDPSLRTLRGWGGYLRAGKEAGDVLVESALNVRSPGFEVNDLAFVTRTDYVWMSTNVARQWVRPTRWYRRADLLAGAQQQYNWDGDLTDRQFHGSASSQLANYWSVSGFFIYRPERDDDRLTRGGPVVRRPADWFSQASVNTDSRRAVVASGNVGGGRSAAGIGGLSAYAGLRFKPAANVDLSLGPSYNVNGSHAQFVRSWEDETATHFHGRRVVFAEMQYRSLSMNTRAAVTFTPNLTLELFAQPLLVSASYDRFREFEAPRTTALRPYGTDELTPVHDDAGRAASYTLRPHGAAGPAFSFRNPDFNMRSLRGNAVLRWEYRPGSTLFLVWQQQRQGFGGDGAFDPARDAAALFREQPDNIFMIKASYWLGR